MNDWLSSTALHENIAQNCDIDQNEMQPMSIADMVTQTAAQVVQQQHSDQLASLGFYWAEECALFYNANTGYCYEPNSALFFHLNAPHLCYRYNAETGQYDQIYAGQQSSSVSPPTDGGVKWSKKAFRRRANRIFGDEFVQNVCQEDVDVVELTLDLVDRCSFLVGGECQGKRSVKRALMETAAALADDEIWAGVSCAGKRLAASVNLAPGDDDFDDDGHWATDEEQSGPDRDSSTERQNAEIARRQQEEEIARNAPCIRLVERPRGRLHIVTICGARVGFGRSMDVQIGADDGANANGGGGRIGPPGEATWGADGKADEEEELFTIHYSAEDAVYRMEWHNANLGAKKDGHCIEPGVSHTVQHECLVTIGGAAGCSSDQHQIWLSFHIHSGLNTCQGCEPGLFTAADNGTQNASEMPKKRLSRFAEHRRQMRALKEQYGLLDGDSPHSADGVELSKKYVDRAGRRRREFGSELPPGATTAATVLNGTGGIYAHCIAAPQPGYSSDSVQLQHQLKGDGPMVASHSAATTTVPISAENKGFKLLKGMGWTEGQGLGKHSQGIRGPIATQFKSDRVGLGTPTSATSTAFSASKISINLRASSKQQRNAEQMRKRFEQIEARHSAAVTHSAVGKK